MHRHSDDIYTKSFVGNDFLDERITIVIWVNNLPIAKAVIFVNMLLKSAWYIDAFHDGVGLCFVVALNCWVASGGRTK